MHPRLPPPTQLQCSRRCLSQTSALLAGHNKWSKIKQKKGTTDAEKSAVYGKATRDITAALRNGGSADPEKNAVLATALRRARAADVPKDNIDKALARATGGKDEATNTRLVYEAMASGTVGIVIECLTDNVTRTNHKLRETLNLHNARFAPVAFLFQKRGCVSVTLRVDDDFNLRVERLWEVAADAGANDFEDRPLFDCTDLVEIKFFCRPQDLARLTNALSPSENPDGSCSSELIYQPCDPAGSEKAVDAEMEASITALVDALEESEDCHRVWTTIDGRRRDTGITQKNFT